MRCVVPAVLAAVVVVLAAVVVVLAAVVVVGPAVLAAVIVAVATVSARVRSPALRRGARATIRAAATVGTHAILPTAEGFSIVAKIAECGVHQA